MGRAFVGCVFHLEFREVSNGRGKFYTGAIAVKGYGRPLGGGIMKTTAMSVRYGWDRLLHVWNELKWVARRI